MCILCGAVIIGLLVAVITGIAYGYNYCMAEFITFTRSDVTVYMRRGNFYDKMNLGAKKSRRTGEEDENNIFTTNTTTDYEDQKPPAESKPLADTWLKTQDTRRYAEILTRYNPNKRDDMHSDDSERQDPSPERESPIQEQPGVIHFKPTANTPVISIIPNPMIPTVSWRSGSSEIVMRNFQPLPEYTPINKNTELPEEFLEDGRRILSQPISIFNPKGQAKETVDEKFNDDFHKSYVPMRVWVTTAQAVITDEQDDIDEENVVYKPV